MSNPNVCEPEYDVVSKANEPGCVILAPAPNLDIVVRVRLRARGNAPRNVANIVDTLVFLNEAGNSARTKPENSCCTQVLLWCGDTDSGGAGAPVEAQEVVDVAGLVAALECALALEGAAGGGPDGGPTYWVNIIIDPRTAAHLCHMVFLCPCLRLRGRT